MDSKNLVSFIISTYNGQETLDQAISSILSQSHINLEILIIDDGSTDDSFDIIQKYANEDKRIKTYKNPKNIGLTKSLNFLIEQAKGEFIARQDDDDISKENRIEKQLDFLIKYNLDAVTSRAKIIGSDNLMPNLSYYFPTKVVIKYKNPFIHGTLLIKKEILNGQNNYDERFYYSQDYKLMTDLIKSNKKIRIIKEPLYLINMKNNISKINSSEQEYYADCVRRNINP